MLGRALVRQRLTSQAGVAVRRYGSVVGYQWGSSAGRWQGSASVAAMRPWAGAEQQSVAVFAEQKRHIFGWGDKEKAGKEKEEREVKEEISEEGEDRNKEQRISGQKIEAVKESEIEGESETTTTTTTKKTAKERKKKETLKKDGPTHKKTFDELFAYYENHAISQHFRHQPRASFLERMIPLTDDEEKFKKLNEAVMVLVKYLHPWTVSQASAYARACRRFQSFDTLVALLLNRTSQFNTLSYKAYSQLISTLIDANRCEEALKIIHRAVEQGHSAEDLSMKEVLALYRLDKFSHAIDRARRLIKKNEAHSPTFIDTWRLSLQSAAIVADEKAFDEILAYSEEHNAGVLDRFAAGRALMSYVRGDDDGAADAVKGQEKALPVLKRMSEKQLAVSKGEVSSSLTHQLSNVDVEAIVAKVDALVTTSTEEAVTSESSDEQVTEEAGEKEEK